MNVDHPRDDVTDPPRRAKRRLSCESDEELIASESSYEAVDARKAVPHESGCGDVFCRKCVVEVPAK